MKFYKKCISNLIKKADIFGLPITLYYDKDSTNSSVIGGLLSLSIVVVILILVANLFIQLISKSSIYSQLSTNYQSMPGVLQLNPTNFMFAISVWDVEYAASFRKNPIFNVQASLDTYYRFLNGTQGYQSEAIPLKFCSSEDFPSALNESFFLSNLEVALCLDYQNLTVQGDYTSVVYQEMTLNISQCINGTNPLYACASQEFIDNYMQNNPQINIDMNFVNEAIQQTNYSNPVQVFNDVVSFILSPGLLARYFSMFFRSVTIYTQSDIFGLSDPDVISTFRYAQEYTDQAYIPTGSSAEYLTVVIRTSGFIENYNRSFDTFGTLLAVVVAYWRIMVVIAAVFTHQVNSIYFNYKLSREMYNIRDKIPRQGTSNHELQQENGSNENLETSYNTKPNLPQGLNTVNLEQKTDLEKKNKVSEFQKEQDILLLNDLICISMCPCLRRKEQQKKKKMWASISDQILKDLDIKTIISAIRQVELLKQVLLASSQLTVFNYIHTRFVPMSAALAKRRPSPDGEGNQTVFQIQHKSIDKRLLDSAQNLLQDSSNLISQNLLRRLEPDIFNILTNEDKAGNLAQAIDTEQEYDNSIEKINLEKTSYRKVPEYQILDRALELRFGGPLNQQKSQKKEVKEGWS